MYFIHVHAEEFLYFCNNFKCEKYMYSHPSLVPSLTHFNIVSSLKIVSLQMQDDFYIHCNWVSK